MVSLDKDYAVAVSSPDSLEVSEKARGSRLCPACLCLQIPQPTLVVCGPLACLFGSSNLHYNPVSSGVMRVLH